jgi:hypothetical protein
MSPSEAVAGIVARTPERGGAGATAGIGAVIAGAGSAAASGFQSAAAGPGTPRMRALAAKST